MPNNKKEQTLLRKAALGDNLQLLTFALQDFIKGFLFFCGPAFLHQKPEQRSTEHVGRSAASEQLNASDA